jgi:hypothetical protein
VPPNRVLGQFTIRRHTDGTINASAFETMSATKEPFPGGLPTVPDTILGQHLRHAILVGAHTLLLPAGPPPKTKPGRGIRSVPSPYGSHWRILVHLDSSVVAGARVFLMNGKTQVIPVAELMRELLTHPGRHGRPIILVVTPDPGDHTLPMIRWQLRAAFPDLNIDVAVWTPPLPAASSSAAPESDDETGTAVDVDLPDIEAGTAFPVVDPRSRRGRQRLVLLPRGRGRSSGPSGDPDAEGPPEALLRLRAAIDGAWQHVERLDLPVATALAQAEPAGETARVALASMRRALGALRMRVNIAAVDQIWAVQTDLADVLTTYEWTLTRLPVDLRPNKVDLLGALVEMASTASDVTQAYLTEVDANRRGNRLQALLTDHPSLTHPALVLAGDTRWHRSVLTPTVHAIAGSFSRARSAMHENRADLSPADAVAWIIAIVAAKSYLTGHEAALSVVANAIASCPPPTAAAALAETPDRSG